MCSFKILLLLSVCYFTVCSCSSNEEILSGGTITFYNPYEGIDFSEVTKVNAITHEHIFTKEKLKSAYDRGIRWFAAVNYQPAVPPYPFSKWSGEYLDYLDDSNDNYETCYTNKGATGSIVSFVDSAGETIITDSLPQIPNAEHPTFSWNKLKDSKEKLPHFNVLGSLWGEAGHGQGQSRMSKIWGHPLWDIYDIDEMFTSRLLFDGKVFGTINHCSNTSEIKRMLDICPNIFKAVEVFNQGSSTSVNRSYRDAYDAILREGYRVWCTAVVDWQGYISYQYDEEKECTFDRGCNVLLINKYNDLTTSEKSEAGLDAYIAGRYYASGLGKHHIQSITAQDCAVDLTVDGQPSSISAITSNRVILGTGNSIHVDINSGETFIRFEVFYYDEAKTDMDFIFTNPIFIEND